VTALLVASLLAFALLLIAWAGYPLALAALARGRAPAPRPARGGAASASASPASVSVVIATRDEPAVVERRVHDVLRTTHPHDRLQIVVAVDPTSHHAPAAYAAVLGDRALVVPGDAPGGKATTLNAGVRAATGELLVFADSQQEFDADAIPLLARYLEDPRFGAVSGGYASAKSEGGKSILDLFWNFEVVVRRYEAEVHSIVAVTGACYAMRRSLWVPLPAHLICDDLFVPMNVVLQGQRVGYCEAARAYDPRRFTRRQEFARKVRTLTGMLQFCAWRPVVLVPWRNPVWSQFVCHKLLRLATPYLAIVVLLGVLALATMLPLRLLAGLVVAGITLVLIAAAARPRLARRVASQLGWAVSLQAAPMVASMNAVRGRWDVWKRH
jgi:biofilm PGA synthesis N-glycosyltransferase PgaC